MKLWCIRFILMSSETVVPSCSFVRYGTRSHVLIGPWSHVSGEDELSISRVESEVLGDRFFEFNVNYSRFLWLWSIIREWPPKSQVPFYRHEQGWDQQNITSNEVEEEILIQNVPSAKPIIEVDSSTRAVEEHVSLQIWLTWTGLHERVRLKSPTLWWIVWISPEDFGNGDWTRFMTEAHVWCTVAWWDVMGWRGPG